MMKDDFYVCPLLLKGNCFSCKNVFSVIMGLQRDMPYDGLVLMFVAIFNFFLGGWVGGWGDQ